MCPPDPKHRTPPPPQPSAPREETARDGSSDGTLDLDDTQQINNQHLEVR